ncbi:hypothetical protein CBS101457_005538 [Exobasidium rhododendri]|nr:hypothetical protein CBS101457_005538 [Exobasidium rhododendri]
MDSSVAGEENATSDAPSSAMQREEGFEALLAATKLSIKAVVGVLGLPALDPYYEQEAIKVSLRSQGYVNYAASLPSPLKAPTDGWKVQASAALRCEEETLDDLLTNGSQNNDSDEDDNSNLTCHPSSSTLPTPVGRITDDEVRAERKKMLESFNKGGKGFKIDETKATESMIWVLLECFKPLLETYAGHPQMFLARLSKDRECDYSEVEVIMDKVPHSDLIEEKLMAAVRALDGRGGPESLFRFYDLGC